MLCLLEVLELPEVMRCALLRMLEVVEGVLYLLEVPETLCMLLCMLEAVEGGLCLLDALDALGVLEVPEVMRCAVRCSVC